MKESRSKSLSNEKEIRKKLIQKYSKLFHRGFIREEFTGPGLSTRNDLFLVHEEIIISFEIKSNRDVLKRLRSQALEYLTYSSMVILALDIKHLKNLEKKFQDLINHPNIKILIFEDGECYTYSDGESKDYPTLLNLLWSSELALFKALFKQRSKVGSSSYDLLKMINEVYNEQQIHDISKSIFLDRVRNSRGSMNYKPVLLEETNNLMNNNLLELQKKFYNYIGK